jgi:protein TonB
MSSRYRIIVSLLVSSFALAASAAALTVAEVTDVSSQVDEAPIPVKTAVPEYPASLRNDKVSGVVSVTIVVDEAGEVRAAEVSKSTHEEFKEPALEAMRRWKFKAARFEGKAVKVKVTIPVRFNAV